MNGLYLLTNEEPWPLLWDKLQCVLEYGVISRVQYRRKHVAAGQRLAEADHLQRLCEAYELPLIINDEVDLAHVLNCGVHLGQSDGHLAAVRQRMGAEAIIGRTCHGSLALAQQAQEEGASYVAFGAVYASGTKPEAQPMDWAVVAQAAQQLDVPVCVIGGITLDNVSALMDWPVEWLAVCGGVLDGDLLEVEQRMRQWRKLLTYSGQPACHQPMS